MYTGSTFTDNRAASWSGVVYISDFSFSLFNITSSMFVDNSAGLGGVMRTIHSSFVNITNSTFINNSATQNGGGAVFAMAGSSLDITDSIFTNNSATQDDGGVVFAMSGSSLDIASNIFVNKSAALSGGVIYIHSGSSVAWWCHVCTRIFNWFLFGITDSSFNDNAADHGRVEHTYSSLNIDDHQ